jgi:hypothetical protein
MTKPWRKLPLKVSGWDWQQAEIFVARAKRPWGDGWALLSDAIQEAMLDQTCLVVAVSQHRDLVSIEAVEQLRRQMRVVAGMSRCADWAA